MNNTYITYDYTYKSETGLCQEVTVELATGEELEKYTQELIKEAIANKKKTITRAKGVITITLKGEPFIDPNQLLFSFEEKQEAKA